MMDATFKFAPGPVVLGMRAPETAPTASARKQVGRREELVNFMLSLGAVLSLLRTPGNELAFIHAW
jgi:hypothetical protein